MNRPLKRKLMGAALGLALLLPAMPARADFWGGDLPLLAQILAQAIQQVAQLKVIINNGQDTLGFMQDINQGIRDAMRLQSTINRTLKTGNWNLADVDDILHQMEELYGKIPMTAEAKTQSTHDMTVAESIQLHNDAFRYADQVDPEA